MAKVVTDTAEFNKIISSGLVVATFSASWSTPHKRIVPFVNQLAADHPKITFLIVDMEEAQELADSHQIEGLPTLKYFQNGTLFHLGIGDDLDSIRRAVAKLEK
eukprot:TRINITY_DN2653_c0_g1_i2.p1 TRINITY_DN2653_c0_g1~~TRINITY_DN2653_c0_g1_i2.p1  ORF type:complete len:104 (-),score=21.19 TRINITY_DN2653_c0_g1_i2:84-395(-)